MPLPLPLPLPTRYGGVLALSVGRAALGEVSSLGRLEAAQKSFCFADVELKKLGPFSYVNRTSHLALRAL